MTASAGGSITRKLWLLVAVVAFVDFVYGAVFVTLMQDAGLPAATIGALAALAGVVTTLLEAISGAWGDRYGRRRVLVAGLVLWGAGQAGFGMAGSITTFAIALPLWAAGQAFYSGAPTALAISVLRAQGGADKVSGVVRGVQVVRWVAASIGAGSVAVLGLALPTNVVVTCAGLALLPIAAWVWRTWPEQRGNADRGTIQTMRGGLAVAVRGQIAVLMLVAALSGTALGAVIFSWQPAVREIGGFPAAALGIFLFAFTVLSAAGAWVQRYLSRVDPVVAAMALLVVVGLLFPFAGTGRLGVVVVFACLEFVVAIVLTTTYVWSHALFPDDLRNTLGSLMATVAALSISAGSWIFGVLWQELGLAAALRTIGYANVTGAAVVLVARLMATRQRSRREGGRECTTTSAGS